MDSVDIFRAMLLGNEDKDSLEERLRQEAEDQIRDVYMLAFSRTAPLILMAKLLTKEERIATLDLIQAKMVEEIEQKLPNDMESILTCARIKNQILEAMDALSEYF